MIPNVLSIAGSDPSGGAGIQADLKAISANGCYAMAALTALTVQNTQGVRDVHLVPAGFVAAQIDAVFDDIRTDAVKIGMIATAEIAAAVAGALRARRSGHTVLDPVMVAKGGAPLLADDAVATLVTELLPLADVVTPNLPELARMTGRPVPESREAMLDAAGELRSMGAQAVFAKGGHLADGASPDLLLSDQGARWFEGDRIETASTHGTGCTLSSALAAWLARGKALPDACAQAKAYVTAAIRSASTLSVGSGHGPTHHFHAFRG